MLPNGIPNRPPAAIAEWAVRAEQLGFDSVGVIDRVAYDSVDPLVALSIAAAVTQHVELVTDVLISPLRSTALLAKQAASLDLVSGGRLTLGVGVGIRADDFSLAGTSYEDRGSRFDAQLEELHRIWTAGTDIGPAPARAVGPRVLVGGAPHLAGRRAARHGDGWTMAIGSPEQFAAGVQTVDDAWRTGGRNGRPQTMAMLYTAVGPQARDTVQAAISSYYAWLGPDLVQWVLSTCAIGEQSLARRIEEFAVAGADELLITPCSADLGQLERIADIALSVGVPA
jgi:alkanesulfonate monooxygenase SsuD/methylene tetrahydromethanopterin reductase-like flavin-dependent oxidoreductase (luciferase family)